MLFHKLLLYGHRDTTILISSIQYSNTVNKNSYNKIIITFEIVIKTQKCRAFQKYVDVQTQKYYSIKQVLLLNILFIARCHFSRLCNIKTRFNNNRFTYYRHYVVISLYLIRTQLTVINYKLQKTVIFKIKRKKYNK